MARERRKSYEILVVDPAADVRSALRSVLREAGFPVTVVADGLQALDHIQRSLRLGLPCPDLVILDLDLPGVDGRHVLDIIRVSGNLAEIEAIIATASEEAADMLRSGDLRVARYVRKPLGEQGLAEIVRCAQELASGKQSRGSPTLRLA